MRRVAAVVQGARAVGPTAENERYEFLDVLRGFALAGIVLANMISLSLYLYLSEASKAALPTAAPDRVLDFLELVFVEGKFYTIFSVLFGIGFSILLTRAQTKSQRFRSFFLRRMLLLFAIGAAHALFFWHNDILEAYAVCGVLLLPFVRARGRTILAAAALALLLPAIINAAGVLTHDTFTGPRDRLFAHYGFTDETRIDVWTAGRLTDLLLLNAGSWFGQVDYVITSGMIFRIFGCFLLGFWIGRAGIHRDLARHGSVVRRLAIAGLVVGLPLNVVFARTFESESPWAVLLATAALLTLSAGYASAVAWLWIRIDNRILISTFAHVGRMALTNYVAQSAIAVLIFRTVGLGLGGTMGPTLYLPVGLGIYLAQLVGSRLWLRHFQYGPLEWLWRTLTYGTRVPLRKVSPAVD